MIIASSVATALLYLLYFTSSFSQGRLCFIIHVCKVSKHAKYCSVKIEQPRTTAFPIANFHCCFFLRHVSLLCNF